MRPFPSSMNHIVFEANILRAVELLFRTRDAINSTPLRLERSSLVQRLQPVQRLTVRYGELCSSFCQMLKYLKYFMFQMCPCVGLPRHKDYELFAMGLCVFGL